MKSARYFSKVRIGGRGPLTHRPFLEALNDIETVLAAVDQIVIQDVREAVLGDGKRGKPGCWELWLPADLVERVRLGKPEGQLNGRTV